MSKTENQAHAWARFMVKMQARAHIVSNITGISAADARRLWHEELARSSPSGQNAHDDAWFLKTTSRRMHGALILSLLSQTQKTLPPHAAFAHAYYHYSRMTAGVSDRHSWETDPAFRASEDDYVIPFGRAHFLSTIYSDDKLAGGARKCKLQVRRCKACEAIYLGHIEEIGRKCPICAAKKL